MGGRISTIKSFQYDESVMPRQLVRHNRAQYLVLQLARRPGPMALYITWLSEEEVCPGGDQTLPRPYTGHLSHFCTARFILHTSLHTRQHGEGTRMPILYLYFSSFSVAWRSRSDLPHNSRWGYSKCAGIGLFSFLRSLGCC